MWIEIYHKYELKFDTQTLKDFCATNSMIYTSVGNEWDLYKDMYAYQGILYLYTHTIASVTP